MAKDKKMELGFVWICSAELKILLTSLLFLCSLATVFQFVPLRFPFSDLRYCISLTAPPPPHHPLQIPDTHIVKRHFTGFGSAAFTFVLMSSYRGGSRTFAVVGLGSKPLHVYSNPSYTCLYIPDNSHQTLTVPASKMFPDWGYGRVYTVVIINCTFPNPVIPSGKLTLRVSTQTGPDDEIQALHEAYGSVNMSVFTSRPKYDYLYCGSSLYGSLSPQRVREWVAYHVRLFGARSHFVIHDAGGVHGEVYEVLQPWIELGFVTLQDIRDQERFDGYYHNQFLIVNDCLHRYRFDTKWMFFFDVDEFIYVPRKNTLNSVLNSLSKYSQFTIEQMPMSSKLCLSNDSAHAYRKWGMEKLVYRNVQKGIRRDRKYAIQPRSAYATGVHMSQNLANGSSTTHKTEHLIKYFHYHGTIAQRHEPCKIFVNATELIRDKIPHKLDTTLRSVASSVKVFELKNVGTRLLKTKQ